MVENYLDHLIENNKAQQPNLTEDQEKQIRSDELNNAIFNIKWYLIKEKIMISSCNCRTLFLVIIQ